MEQRMETEMDEQLKERCSLVQERICGIYEEAAERGGEYAAYWKACALLAMGKRQDDMRYADYLCCRNLFGEEAGRCYCLLFAQLLFVPELTREEETELSCASSELMVQLYRMVQENEKPAALRDTLYWFYSDYCGVYTGYHAELIRQGEELCFGGPMLLMSCRMFDENPVWRQHRTDYGLYMGNRYQERYVQAVLREGGRFGGEMVSAILRQLSCRGKVPTAEGGFGVSQRQEECLERTLCRIRAGLEKKDPDVSCIDRR